ncbi:MAG: hypothetical protein AAB968_01575, partial [Patescibacteria group bacterium]
MDITYVVDKDTRYSQDDISAIVEPGKILGYRSPKEVFFKERFFTIKFHGACGRCLRMERIWAFFQVKNKDAMRSTMARILNSSPRKGRRRRN